MIEDEQYYMGLCLNLAKTALASGDPPVGAVVVFEGKVIGTGIESGRSTGDITNHAEILAVKDAVKNGYADKLHLTGMYTTHEPCLMCSYVIRQHHISKIVYGTSVPYTGGATSEFKILSTHDVPKWGTSPEITAGICFEECIQLNEEYKKVLSKL